MDCEDKQLTFGDIRKFFGEQFPGLIVGDYRPNGPNELYVWIDKSPTNIIATYYPEAKTFTVKTTYEKWYLYYRGARNE